MCAVVWGKAHEGGRGRSLERYLRQGHGWRRGGPHHSQHGTRRSRAGSKRGVGGQSGGTVPMSLDTTVCSHGPSDSEEHTVAGGTTKQHLGHLTHRLAGHALTVHGQDDVPHMNPSINGLVVAGDPARSWGVVRHVGWGQPLPRGVERGGRPRNSSGRGLGHASNNHAMGAIDEGDTQANGHQLLVVRLPSLHLNGE